MWCTRNMHDYLQRIDLEDKLLSKLLISIIELYQRLAPEKIRNACRFTPTCSEYMKVAIDMYGAITGVKKGLKRLRRCKYPNGGEDYP